MTLQERSNLKGYAMFYSHSDPAITRAINEAHEMRAAALRDAFVAIGHKISAAMHALPQALRRSRTV